MPCWWAAEKSATAISWKEISGPKNGWNTPKRLLKEIGLEPERLEMFHIGASDAPAWARAVTEMTRRARDLGPNPLKKRNKTVIQNVK